MRQSSGFTIEVVPANERVILAVSGELDLDTARQLQAELDGVRETGFRDVVVDLRGVTFLDSTGIRVLVEEHRAAQANAYTFSLAYGEGPVERALDLTGLSKVLAVVPAVASGEADRRHAERITTGWLRALST